MKLRLTHLSPAVLLMASLFPTDADRAADRAAPGSTLGSTGRTKASAKRVDAMVELDLRRHKIEPNRIASDSVFLRRAYLSIVGRIPTAAETRGFLSSQDPAKRDALVDQLLDSPGHRSRMFNYWTDILRVKSRMRGQLSGEPYIHYLKDSLAANKPYDRMVREMLTANGPAHQRGNGATGYYMRDRNMPLDNMANTARIFLGTRLECAQCHNHPFDKWKQKDFYRMAAFTSGIGYRSNLQSNPRARNIRRLFMEYRSKRDRTSQRTLGQIIRGANQGVTGNGVGAIRLPKDYKYKDGKPYDVLTAKALFGKHPKVEVQMPSQRRDRRGRRNRNRNRNRRRGNRLRIRQINSMQTYAEWMTSPKNPRFTKVIANRMWKLVMGRGLIEPVDNMMDDTKASNPGLMRYLEKLMVDLDYDLKEFQRVLYKTKLFQREAEKDDTPADKKYYFPGPTLRRMTGEQMWDSMLTMAVQDIDKKLQPVESPRAKRVYDTYERLLTMSDEQLRTMVEQRSQRFRNPEKFRAEQRKRRQAEMRKRAAEQKRRRQRQRRMQDQERQRIIALRKKLAPQLREFYRARRDKDQARMNELAKQLLAAGYPGNRLGGKWAKEWRDKMRRRNRGRRGRGRGNQLVRASDLPQPAPNGHFVRRFGQSDRDQIQTGHTEANVPQVLSLLNGFVENRVLGFGQSVLRQELDRATTPKDKIRAAYLSILNREPRGRELAIWAADVQKLGGKAYQDLVWTLVNTHEFRFIQ